VWFGVVRCGVVGCGGVWRGGVWCGGVSVQTTCDVQTARRNTPSSDISATQSMVTVRCQLSAVSCQARDLSATV